MPSIYHQLALLQCYRLMNFSLFIQFRKKERPLVSFFHSMSIDTAVPGLPLFESAVKTDVLAVLLVYEVHYCESNRYAIYHMPQNLLWQ